MNAKKVLIASCIVAKIAYGGLAAYFVHKATEAKKDELLNGKGGHDFVVEMGHMALTVGAGCAVSNAIL